MASVIKAGNATNGVQVSSDNTGILQLSTGTGSGTTALTLDASQNATLAGTLAVGAVTSTGLVTGATGALYPIVSETAKAYNWNGLTNNTVLDFTGIPSWVKRITVMFNGVSTNGTSGTNVQLGDSGGVENTGYICGNVYFSATGINGASATNGFNIRNTLAADTLNGSIIISLLASSTNTWVAQGVFGSANSANNTFLTNGSSCLPAPLIECASRPSTAQTFLTLEL